MGIWLTLIVALVPAAAFAARIDPEVTRGPEGAMVVAHLAEAPFPDGKSKWNDDTVLIFVPAHYRVGPKVSMLVHFHGHQTTAKAGLEGLKLVDQLLLSRQEAVLVAPQGPLRAADSSSGKLERPEAFAKLLRAVLKVLRTVRLAPKGCVPGHVVVTAHSGGFEAAADAAKHGGHPIAQLILIDALYGRFDDFASWIAGAGSRRFASIQTEGGRPDERSEKLKARLKRLGVRWLVEEREGQLSRLDLVRNRVLFLRSRLGHYECGFAHLQVRDLLMASPFTRRLETDWFRERARVPRPLDRWVGR